MMRDYGEAMALYKPCIVLQTNLQGDYKQEGIPEITLK